MHEISDDDDSFTKPECSKGLQNDDTILLTSDEESISSDEKGSTNVKSISISSDDDNAEVIEQKRKAVKKLFASNNVFEMPKDTRNTNFPKNNNMNNGVYVPPTIEKPKVVYNYTMTGVNVKLPVIPYKSQMALMSKIIKGMKESKNCILESPTGSGKTLALLCSVLAWQQYEQDRLYQAQAKRESEEYFKQYPELQKTEVRDFIASPASKKTDVTPEKLFSKTNFGEKSIYQKSEENGKPSTSNKRTGPYMETETDDESPTAGLVNIHKKRRQGSIDCDPTQTVSSPATPKKTIQMENEQTPEKVRKLYDLVNNLRLRTSILVDCRVPTIYYGARTHTQLQQVIKEFKRTSYCGVVKMSILSSRDKSCIREYRKDLWKSRNDMCRACIKKKAANDKKSDDTNCMYYDNRRNLNHKCLPPAFDIEELVAEGENIQACPFYAAREMAKVADIVFCPYNYLIDPTIRNSLKISLEDNVIVIDEAHNIENICRDAATLSITQIQVQDALGELKKAMDYRFQNDKLISYLEVLVTALKNWDDWFENQQPLIKNMALDNNKAEYVWEAQHFVHTLDNHNIGYKQYNSFQSASSQLSEQLRDDPRALLGVSQASATLLEALALVLGFLFRDECKHIDDYAPVLERNVTGKTNGFSSWRKSKLDEDTYKWLTSDVLSLKLYCMNPAIVMSSLHVARSIVLASGTLTPMGNIHAELGTPFPLTVSPSHVIPVERVWVGAISGVSDTNGLQEYKSDCARSDVAQTRFGHLVLRVCQLTPHGVLCFFTSYGMLNAFKNAWEANGIWNQLEQLKHVFCEQRSSSEHEEMMKQFYECVSSDKGALLFAVYRGKVSEGMDFKDEQARAVICMGIPFPNTYDIAVKAKLDYNDKYASRGLLSRWEWLRVQAFRALNQAAGRCVRHARDWGGVLLVDARYCSDQYSGQLSKWVLNILGNNTHTYESLLSSENGLAKFMQRMKIIEETEES